MHFKWKIIPSTYFHTEQNYMHKIKFDSIPTISIIHFLGMDGQPGDTGPAGQRGYPGLQGISKLF